MAIALNVTGPHIVKWSTTTSNYAELGRTDNDDLFNIEIEYKYSDIQTNEFGAMPADAILMGAAAFVNFTMVSYDAVEIEKLFNACNGGSGQGVNFPEVGALAIGSSDNLISLFLDASIAGRPEYTVDKLRLISHNLRDIGNKPTRAAFRFEIMAVSAGRAIYTVS
jgi:hypothetical protein